ncbi:hypothetical protein [Antarcticirhabdus aurantiaca]|uniref:hypothetical protein n=1 Tax=Antarcticirhabdus aurantiaca TaxID=2606717 RepID=UPI00131B95ED|nr:hypothetical protein [Antarcticirhabdus aurantiaca]
MSQRRNYAQAEILGPADLNDMGLFAQAAGDNLAGDAVGYPSHWAGFTVAIRSTQELRISAGRFFEGRVVYAKGDETIVNLQSHIPRIATDERWVAILVNGKVETIESDRSFRTGTDPETATVVTKKSPSLVDRTLEFRVQQAQNAPPPALRPVVAATDCCVAYVRLTASGIQTIEPGEAFRVKSLFEIGGRVTDMELNLTSLRLRTEAIETNLANVNEKITTIPRPELIRNLMRDAATVRRLLNFPREARQYWYDPGLVPDQWGGPKQGSTGDADWLARVREGVRFPWEASKQGLLRPKNEDDQRIRLKGRKMMPVYTEAVRIQNLGSDGSRNISQLQHTITTAVQRTVSRSAVSYGPTVQQCENVAEWANLVDRQAGETFSKGNETFQVVGLADHYNNTVPELTELHAVYNIREVQTRSWTETYWDYVTEIVGVNGSVYAQTFLNAQPMVVTAINLFVTRKGTDGDIHLFLCETTDGAAPRFDKVLGKMTLKYEDIVLGKNRCEVPLAFLEPGRRFAWFTVTTGNHALATTGNNKFQGGTLFYGTDGGFAQGDLLDDFAFEIVAAHFTNVRTVVDFNAMDLPGGMTQFDLLYSSWAPAGTGLEWLIKPDGSNVWFPLKIYGVDNPLVGLPASCELRLVMIATPDLGPMIEIDNVATWTTSRPRNEMRAVSDTITFAAATSKIQTDVVVDAFDGDVNTAVPRLKVGGATLTADVITMTPDPDKPTRRRYLATFILGTPTTTAKLRFDMATTNKVVTPFIQNAAAYAH